MANLVEYHFEACAKCGEKTLIAPNGLCKDCLLLKTVHCIEQRFLSYHTEKATVERALSKVGLTRGKVEVA